MEYNQKQNVTGYAHGSLAQCLVGFGLSVILTVVPFWLVLQGFVSDQGTALLVIILCAVAQIIVHLMCFLHMNLKLEEGWSCMAIVFTIIIIAICFVGSVWVMYHLNNNMMPMNPSMRGSH
ncbi:MAG: cytochrome o ubiquinol oxidase subunit IV [Candidatus Liberibacter ctenarytainae]|uniref:Cytochrome bo(3) ubiquinol oxidase subunit 4 n=1 Tax=Candidatus Liberibacter ctenarytainae TaxID=2020335 RepID=A0A937AC43_9HYPH|nr:cytochrome o ubiquinol oxidase subunit IV [Candidatus Liberibacter ctenarytainae]